MTNIGTRNVNQGTLVQVPINPIEKIINDYSLMILDGAFSTELERRGADINDELWSAKILMESPDMIGQVHYDYFAAGADCAITASYQATIPGFMRRGLNKTEAIRLIQDSVHIAVKARDAFWAKDENRVNRPKPLVAASVGPYGAFLADGSEYRGDYEMTEEELMMFQRPRMKALIESGADLLACETIPCMIEARAIVRVLEEFPGTYAWVSFSAKDGVHISDGEEIAGCASWLDGHDQVAAVGVNCTAPQYIVSLIKEIRKNTAKPVVVYPNSGEQYDAVSKTWDNKAAKISFGCDARSWYEAGAQLIGGCCRITPKDIQSIVSWARKG